MTEETACMHTPLIVGKVGRLEGRESTRDSLVAQTVKHLPAMLETWVRSPHPGRQDPLEKETATHSSTLA